MTATVRGISAGGRGSNHSPTTDEYTVVYKVETDSRLDGPDEVHDAFGIPDVGSVYSAGNDTNVNAVVIDKSVSQSDDTPFEWEVEVRYSTLADQDPSTQIDNPLLKPPALSYGFTTRRIIIPGLYTNAAQPDGNRDWEVGLLAPNDEPFDPQPEVDISEPVLTIQRNVATIQSAALMALADTVNADFFDGAEPRTLRLMAPQAQQRWHKIPGDYWEVTYQIAFRYATWDVQVLNQGSYYWTNSGTTINNKVDETGAPYIVNLTTTGGLNETGTPTFTRVRYYREINFGSLGLL